MFKTILIATDGSELAEKAVNQGLQLAKDLGAQAIVVTVTEPWMAYAMPEGDIAFPIGDYQAAVAASAARTLTAATNIAKKIGIVCDVVHVKDAFASEGIIAECKKIKADLIVMASHGRRGVTRILLGSQANKVVTHSTVPVLICR